MAREELEHQIERLIQDWLMYDEIGTDRLVGRLVDVAMQTARYALTEQHHRAEYWMKQGPTYDNILLIHQHMLKQYENNDRETKGE